MAISLNDHENRIKVLESRNGYFSIETLYGDNPDSVGAGDVIINLKKPYTEFDIIRLITTNGGKESGIQNMCDFSSKYITSAGRCGVDFDGGSSSIVRQGSSTTKFEVINGRPNYLYAVYGIKTLKLYYNFSYNKLVRFLSHLNTKFGGERR